jgi:uncharacterized protein (TIGR03382 family)
LEINALDADDDGDGIQTIIETTRDSDCAWPSAVPAPDGIPNYLDRDSDNDGLLDDLNGDGLYFGDGLGDVDGDFIPDFEDCDNTGCDGDSDYDGIDNCDEAAICESQGIYDTVACTTNPDWDGDGIIDGDELGSLSAPQDTDGDGQPDMFDTDDDGDGFDTRTELGIYCPSGEDWVLILEEYLYIWLRYCPSDMSILTDPLQNTDADLGGAWPITPDSIPDYLDTDDDGDGNPTDIEGDGDIDGDGLVNYLDMNDADGPLGDVDQDGIDNQTELALGMDPNSNDSDGDGISDEIEIGNAISPTDSDGDGIIDALDEDDDDDGIPTSEEGAIDTDGDGTPDYLDPDSDGDGIADIDEATMDSDCDGIPDSSDTVVDSDCSTDGLSLLSIEWDGCDGCSSSGPRSSLTWLALVGLVGLRRRRK